MEQNTKLNDVEKNAQEFATCMMSLNRQQRRAFAKKNGTQKIYGSTKPYINEEKRLRRLKRAQGLI